MKIAVLLLLLATSCSSGHRYSAKNPPLLPDPKLTPGSAFSNVSVEEVCAKGYANALNGGVRHVSESEERKVFIEYFGVVPPNPGDYEIDHLVSLEISGDNSIRNLWPQARFTQPWNAGVKDKLEDRMAALLRQCLKERGHAAATALMRQFDHEVATNWTNAFVRYFGAAPK